MNSIVKIALAAETRDEMLDTLNNSHCNFSLTETLQLKSRLKLLSASLEPVRIAFLRTYTTEMMAPSLEYEALVDGYACDVFEGPYGNILQELEAGSGLLLHNPDLTVLFLTWADLHPDMDQPVMVLAQDDRKQLADLAVETCCGMLNRCREVLKGTVVATLLPKMLPSELGLYDSASADSEKSFRETILTRIKQWAHQEVSGVFCMALDKQMEEVGRERFFDARMWFSSRYPFSVEGSRAVARWVMTCVNASQGRRAKCIILDCDNTLWGGVVGEDGLTGIGLGPQYPGAAYMAFQRRLLDFRSRGFLLSICSKNNQADVDAVLEEHPHQILKREHFAAMRINWDPKPGNLLSLAEELNIGVDSFVFVDDSPQECLLVRQALPEVCVVRVPDIPEAIPFCLDHIRQLEVLEWTDEDRQRPDMYHAESRRRDLAVNMDNLDAYLESLKMRMRIMADSVLPVARVAQLTQKTNQFNLTTKRYETVDVQNFANAEDCLVMGFSLEDIFGDYGIVGVAIVHLDASVAEIDTFLMSCRVIGRQVEVAFLAAVLSKLVQTGSQTVRATYQPTQKNGQVAEFYEQQGFKVLSTGKYEGDIAALLSRVKCPSFIHMEDEEERVHSGVLEKKEITDLTDETDMNVAYQDG